MSSVAIPSARVSSWPTFSSRPFTLTRTQARVAALVLTTVVALGFRVAGLSTYGLSEDEVNKVRAIEQYQSGHFSANAEHPMLMKLAIWGTVELQRAWNLAVPPHRKIAFETAVRLPNAVAGAATTAVLFGVAELLFGTGVAVVASTLWALDVNAIAINRIGKEDSFLLLFFLLAIWCYERAKVQGATDPEGAQRWYTASGASFGLMLASKYFPHFLGLYALYNTITDREPGANRPDRWRHYGAMLVTFLAANVAVLMPETWRYCVSYVQGGMLPHHGYLYAGHLYINNIPISPLGLPVTYYLRFVATKLPLAVLTFAAVGLVEMARHRNERGFVLLRVLVVFLLVPYSLMAAKFLRYTLPLVATIDLMAAVGFITLLRRSAWHQPSDRRSAESSRSAGPVTAAALTLTLATAVVAPVAAAPFYSLYQNPLGDRLAAPGATFSEETYDFGVREAVKAVLEAARPSAVIVSDAPGVVRQCLIDGGRWDIRARSLSGEGIPYGPEETWVIVQDEHTTFENRDVVEQLRQRVRPWREFRARNVLAAQLFRLEGR